MVFSTAISLTAPFSYLQLSAWHFYSFALGTFYGNSFNPIKMLSNFATLFLFMNQTNGQSKLAQVLSSLHYIVHIHFVVLASHLAGDLPFSRSCLTLVAFANCCTLFSLKPAHRYIRTLWLASECHWRVIWIVDAVFWDEFCPVVVVVIVVVGAVAVAQVTAVDFELQIVIGKFRRHLRVCCKVASSRD